MILIANRYLLAHQLQKGDDIVVARLSSVGGDGWSNFIKLHRLG